MRTLIKVHPDKRLYVIWSSVIEGPVAWGTRPQLTDSGKLYDILRKERLIQDKSAFTVASAHGSATEYGERSEYDWDCEPIPYVDNIEDSLSGRITRAALPDFMEALIEAEKPGVPRSRRELLAPYLIA